MKSILTLSALALAGAISLPAQAATWSLGDTAATGLREGAVAFDGQPAGVEIGNLTDDLNEKGMDYVAAGSWRGLAASLGGNSVDMHLSHEAYATAAEGGDAAVASMSLYTSAGLDNAHINTDVVLSASIQAPASLTQDFIITAGLGEAIGDSVLISFAPAYVHEAVVSEGFATFMYSAYDLYLNGDLLDFDSASGVGAGTDSWNFLAKVGDTVTLRLLNTSQVGVAGLALAAGATPEAWAYGEAGATLTITPVPEPETWAMLAIGLGLVGLRLRHKSPINPILGA